MIQSVISITFSIKKYRSIYIYIYMCLLMIIESFTVPTMSSQHFSTPLISSAIGQVDTGKSGLCSKYLAVQSIIIAQVWPCKAFQWHQNLQLAICLCYRPSQHKRLKYTQTKLRHIPIPQMIQEKMIWVRKNLGRHVRITLSIESSSSWSATSRKSYMFTQKPVAAGS